MKRRLSNVAFILITTLSWANANEIAMVEFHDRPITEIVLVVAELAGVSIIADQTVIGRASYHFSHLDLLTSLHAFLETHGLYLTQKENIYHVSRVHVAPGSHPGGVTVHARHAPLEVVLDRVTTQAGTSVICDALPNLAVSLHLEEAPIKAILEVITASLPNYHLVQHDHYYEIRINQTRTIPGSPPTRTAITVEEEGVSIEAHNVRLSELLVTLFQRAQREYLTLAPTTALIEHVAFTRKGFDRALELILQPCNLTFTQHEGVYHLYELPSGQTVGALNTTALIPVHHLQAREVLDTIPPSLLDGCSLCLIPSANALRACGPPRVIEEVTRYIDSIDCRPLNRRYCRFALSHISALQAIETLPQELTFTPPRALKDGNTIVMNLSQEQERQVAEYLNLIDHASMGYLVELRYLRSEQLLENLPPSIDRANLTATTSPTRLFFTGSIEQRKRFLRELRYLDRPVPQVRYELLVLQTQTSEASRWNIEAGFGDSTIEDRTAFVGAFDSLLAIDFDVISTFGSTFAFQLDWELANSTTHVMADTTLNGLSGEKIQFRNTNTFRYRDQEIDTETGERRSTGVTRELTSGLIIDIDGWVSGDGMITMEVAATVSRRGSTANLDSNPPPTSERIVTTHVRTASGEPVVLSGLVQRERDDGNKRVPILSRLPLIGALFRDRQQHHEESELVIYIVPYVELRDADDDESLGVRLERLYQRVTP